MDKQFNITMTRKEQREYAQVRSRTLVREEMKKQKYSHHLMCTCNRCEPGIVTKWRKMNVKGA